MCDIKEGLQLSERYDLHKTGKQTGASYLRRGSWANLYKAQQLYFDNHKQINKGMGSDIWEVKVQVSQFNKH